MDGDPERAHVGVLSHRSPDVQGGGGGSTFGGAIDDGETPWHAAIRKTSEEIEGIDVGMGAVAAKIEVPVRTGSWWSYTTFAVRIPIAGKSYLPRIW